MISGVSQQLSGKPVCNVFLLCALRSSTPDGNKIVPNGTAFRYNLSHTPPMRMRDLTPTQLSSVCCPTCGVPAGQRCLLHSGALRSESHVDRKLAAAEAIEAKRYRRTQSFAKRVASSRPSIR